MSKIKVNKLPNSEIEIEGAIEAPIFEEYYKKALGKLGANLEVAGFRKGKVPENVVASKIPESQILAEMAELAISEAYPKILTEEKIDAISRPQITITKLARNNPLEYKIKTAVMPEMTMPDYKALSKKVMASLTDEDKNTEVTEKELEDTIMDIRKSRAAKKNVKDVAKESTKEKSPDDEKDSVVHDHEEVKEENLPEVNDEFVQALGPFKDVADFREKLKENIKLEKGNQAKERARLKIIEKIIEELKIELPEILIEVELDKILYKMQSDITQMGLKFEDYLKHIKKTIDDLKKEFRADAEKKAKVGLIVSKIAELEKITPDPKQMKIEVEAIMAHYKDADPERARLHVENVLTNEGVFQLLETQ